VTGPETFTVRFGAAGGGVSATARLAAAMQTLRNSKPARRLKTPSIFERSIRNHRVLVRSYKVKGREVKPGDGVLRSPPKGASMVDGPRGFLIHILYSEVVGTVSTRDDLLSELQKVDRRTILTQVGRHPLHPVARRGQRKGTAYAPGRRDDHGPVGSQRYRHVPAKSHARISMALDAFL